MRFLGDGPSIPDELLQAHDDGQVVVFSGSGVSRAKAKLPDFAGLAESVLDHLGADHTSQARQLLNFMLELQQEDKFQGVIAADQVFGKLTRDFAATQIDQAVATALACGDDVDLSAHRTVLRLAKSQGGDTRLITTNFDLLFEACDKKLRSRSRATLPRLEYEETDWGIVHVHGRLTPDKKSCDADGFVLTSAQFGDAYLAQGWARDFVRSVLERHVALFIGYSADDPPMRYLLEGLLQSGGIKNKAFAFVAGKDEEAIALWREKGVRAISYPVTDDGSHQALWSTLDEWAKRAADPIKWRDKVLRKARRGPRSLQPHERGMVAHLVRSGSGARAFCRHAPVISAEWLCVFDLGLRYGQPGHVDGWMRGDFVDPQNLYRLDDDPPRPAEKRSPFSQSRIPDAWDAFAPSDQELVLDDMNQIAWVRGHFAARVPRLTRRLDALSDWIVRVAHDPTCVWWAGRQAALHPGLLEGIQHRLEYRSETVIPAVVRSAWRSVFEFHEHLNGDSDQQYGIQQELAQSGWSPAMHRRLRQVFRPQFKDGVFHRRPIPPDSRKKLYRSDLVNLDIEYPSSIDDLVIPDDQLLGVIRGFRANLELAEEWEREFGLVPDVCSITPPDPQTLEGESSGRDYGISGYVLSFVGLVERLRDYDPQAAADEVRSWRGELEVFARLRVWATGIGKVGEAHDFARVLLALSDTRFWPFRGERDLLLGLECRWSGLPDEDQKALLKRIKKGPPARRWRSKDENARSSAHARLSRLLWLENRGFEINFIGSRLEERLKAAIPDWRDSWAEHAADDHDGRSGTVRTNRDWQVLKDAPLGEIIEVAKANEGRRDEPLVRHEPFRGLVQDRPLRAFSALVLSLKKGVVHSNYWSTFLETQHRKEDKLPFRALIALRIGSMRSDQLMPILYQVAQWSRDSLGPLRTAYPEAYNAVWDAAISTISEYPERASSAMVRQDDEPIDWSTEAINSPAGKLAELHASTLEWSSFEPGGGLPGPWKERANQMLALPADSSRFALSIFAFYLNNLHLIDPEWAEQTFLKTLDSSDADQADVDAIWAGFSWAARMPSPNLFDVLKPHLIEMAKQSERKRRRDSEVLSGILLAGWGTVTPGGSRYVSSAELRTILVETDDDFRSHLLWNLENWSRERLPKGEDEPTDGAAVPDADTSEDGWSAKLPDFLREVWPKHAKVQTARASARLVDIALSQGDRFPVVAPIVASMIVPVEGEHIYIPQLRRSEYSLASRYPEAMLDLLYAVLPLKSSNWPYGAAQALREIRDAAPALLDDARLIELLGRLGDR